MSDVEAQKRAAAAAAAERYVRSGMRLGLGTGTTASFLLDELAERLGDGRLAGLRGVPTSSETARVAARLGVPLATLEQLPQLDLALDGADEIAPDLSLIKGAGGAHLREKVVAAASRETVVVADETKLVGRLGERARLPVEVIPFALPVAGRLLRGLGWEPELRAEGGRPFVTDEGNHILHCRRDEWTDTAALARDVSEVPGVVEHGFFLGMAEAALVGTADGTVRELRRP